MTVKTEIETQVDAIFKARWNISDGYVVPNSADISMGNYGRNLEACVLYADLADSTAMVDNNSAEFAAEIYKTFLYTAAKLIRSNGGEITAYDGDRVMAIYVAENKCSRAAKTALQLKWAVEEIISPQLKARYPGQAFSVNHVCGIDTSKVMAARTGIRGNNDLVWVGRAANYAAKLCSLHHSVKTYLTAEVYRALSADVKYSNGKDMWTPYRWVTFDNRTIYGSTYRWRIS